MSSSLFINESHSKGFTCINYDDKLDYVITGGNDGHIKVWSDETKNIIMSYKLSSEINSIVSETDRVFSASASNKIESHSIINKDNTMVLSQFASNVNYMQINKDKTRLVACSDDFSIKLIKLDSDNKIDNSREIVFDGHEAPVISVAINCKSDLIASSSCDGCVIVWDIDKKCILKSFPYLNKFKDISDISNYCRIKWNPENDKILLIPLDDEIRIMDCMWWTTIGSFKWREVTLNNVTECSYSNDGKYLAAGTTDGWIIIWDVASRKLLTRWRSLRRVTVTSLLWHPKHEQTILFADINGFWETIEMSIDQDKEVIENDGLTQDEIEELFDDMADEDLEESSESVKKTSEDKIKSLDDDKSTGVNEDEDDLGDTDDMEGIDLDRGSADEISLEELKAAYASPVKGNLTSGPVQVVTTKIVHAKRKPHAPIRSTSCPRNGNEQLLLWNSVAALKKHFDDDEQSGFLEIDFQDGDIHRNLIYRNDAIEYHMGDVNRHALLLVSCNALSKIDKEEDSDEDDDDDIDETVYIHARPINSSWREWNHVLPVKEIPVGCCLVGDSYAILLTTRFVRYFHLSSGGMQVHIESIHGSPVAIASSNVVTGGLFSEYDRVVIVVDDGNQLMWRMEQLVSSDKTKGGTNKWMERGKMTASNIIIGWQPLPLSGNGATLTYIGFSNSGKLYTVDSKHCVRQLYIDMDQSSTTFTRWSPVLDLRAAMSKDRRSSDRYFPVAFMDARQDSSGVMVVHCRDTKYPRMVPWPHLTMLPFQIPFMCGDNNEVALLEQSLALNQLIPDWNIDADGALLAEKQLLLKLFANAIVQEKDSRAFVIAGMMPDSQTIQLAIRFAARNKKHGLAQRLGELALQRDEMEEVVMISPEEIDEKERMGITEQSPVKVVRGGSENVSHVVIEDSSSDSLETEEEEEKEDDNNNIDEAKSGQQTVRQKQIESTPIESPFRIIKTTANISRRGVAVLDTIATTMPKKPVNSPKKSNLLFGNFVPKPSEQSFKLKTKRKSSKPVDSPLAKTMKK